MFQDYILNREGHGAVGEQLASCGFDPGLLRPYRDERGMTCFNVNTGRTKFDTETEKDNAVFEEYTANELPQMGFEAPVGNATSLRKDDWLKLDSAVLKAARQRLRAWSDLASANTFGGFDGMSKMVLEHETMSDPGEALVDMDALTDGRTDSPKFQLEGLPLPITHSDFWFSQRRLAVSKNSKTPLDFTMAEAAGRRVAETIEKTLIGVTTGITYGDASGVYGVNSNAAPKVYGYTNYPNRVTKTDATAPTGSNGTVVLTQWLAMRELMYAQKFYGPFMVYTSANWDQYLDNLFSSTEPSAGTLRSRLAQIDGIKGIRRLDFLPGTTGGATHDVVWVQMTSDVARAVNGMGLTTVQWPSQGGMRTNFKVMAIHVPQLRSDYDGNCGIGHSTCA